MEQKGLFENYKYCQNCRRPLPVSYDGECCPHCKEQTLFQSVKDYIRSNEVNEYDVAEHFHLPLSKVKQWIREGRIEYKDDALNEHITFHCQKCGAQISFGTLCTKCLKTANMSGHTQTTASSDDTRMRFLENANH